MLKVYAEGKFIMITPNHIIQTDGEVKKASSLRTGEKLLIDRRYYPISKIEEYNFGIPVTIKTSSKIRCINGFNILDYHFWEE